MSASTVSNPPSSAPSMGSSMHTLGLGGVEQSSMENCNSPVVSGMT